jgi:hypothetical protein
LGLKAGSVVSYQMRNAHLAMETDKKLRCQVEKIELRLEKEPSK